MNRRVSIFSLTLSKCIAVKLRIGLGRLTRRLCYCTTCANAIWHGLKETLRNFSSGYSPVRWELRSQVIVPENCKTYNPVAFDGGTDLLGSWRDVERGFRLQSVVESLFRDVRASAHVFVRAVCAGTDQTDLDLVRPAVLLGALAYSRSWMLQIPSILV